MSEPVQTPQVLTSGLTSTECPRWHEGELYFSDILGVSVLAVSPSGNTRVVTEVPGSPGGLGWLPDGTLLIVSQQQRQILRLDTDGLNVHADLTEFGGSALNDMWVGEDGTAYVGEIGFDFSAFLNPRPGVPKVEVQPGQVFRIDPAGAVQGDLGEGLRFPNGIARSPVTGNLIVAETFGFALTEFVQDQSGTWTKAGTTKLGFAPDGIAIDTQDCVWVADPAGHRAVRLNLDGEELQVVPTGRPCLAVALGGADGRTLFLCTTPSTEPEELHRLRDSRIDFTTVEVPGR